MTTFDESFRSAEQEAFRFLGSAHGFCVVEREVARAGSLQGVVGHVVYQSPGSPQGLARAVRLTIVPLRLQLDLQVSRTTSAAYAIEELHALDGHGLFPAREHGLYDAMHNPGELLAEFTRLAGVLRACGTRFFNDEPDLWDDLDAQRGRRNEDEAIRRTLALSKELFRARDWLGVVELLGPIEFRLGSNASARLAYAKRKMREGP